MWMYEQCTGIMSRHGRILECDFFLRTRNPRMSPWECVPDSDGLPGRILGQGYSGAIPYQNQSMAESFRNLGPIPRGLYRISRPYNGPTPFTMELEPVWHDAHERMDLLIHGDYKDKDPRKGNASRGCIILSPGARHEIANSGDDWLSVY